MNELHDPRSEQFPSPEEIEREQQRIADQDEVAEYYLSTLYSENPPVETNKVECEPSIKALEELFDTFEAAHSLEELFTFTDITIFDAIQYHTRESAKDYLITMLDLLHKIRDRTNITTERYKELHRRYMHYSRAVGIINGTTISHDRIDKDDET